MLEPVETTTTRNNHVDVTDWFRLSNEVRDRPLQASHAGNVDLWKKVIYLAFIKGLRRVLTPIMSPVSSKVADFSNTAPPRVNPLERFFVLPAAQAGIHRPGSLKAGRFRSKRSERR
jgi:hypothetical protein